MKTERTKPVRSNRVSAHANTVVTYDELFRQLVIEHPAPEISHDLYHMIVSGRIAWNMRADEGRLAGFSVVMSHQGDDADEPNGHPVPVLFIHPALFSPQNQLIAPLVLYHEYQHILQWQSGEIEESAFYLQTRGEESNLSHLCEQRRQAEESAYRNECVFARRVGLAHLSLMCSIADATDFEVAIVEMLARDPFLGTLCH